jgi:hypothetical protein
MRWYEEKLVNNVDYSNKNIPHSEFQTKELTNIWHFNDNLISDK